MRFNKFILAILAIAFTAFACKKENEPEAENEEELITTVNLTFTPTEGGDAVVFSFVDLDGEGSNEPVITNGTLKVNTSYDLDVKFLNELENPAEDITEEVNEEGTDHQLFFLISNSLNLDISYSDADANGNPIGLKSSVQTGETSSGNLRVILRHLPKKTAEGVPEGFIENAGGSTDVEVEFSPTIQ